MSQSHPSYTDSGVAWLGDIPSTWATARLRFLVTLNPSKSEIAEFDRDDVVSFIPMEAVGEQGELALNRVRPIAEVENGYTYFRDGDVTFAKITPCFENGKRAIMRGLVSGCGFGTTELTVLRPRAGITESDFVFWLISAPEFRLLGEASMYGAGGQKRVPDSFVRDFIAPVPPLPEQRAIAAFLDRETGKIDALVEAQRRLIALLKEKRQAVISHAVTKGLDPDVRMKESAVEWLGEIPVHWEATPLKYLVTFRSGGTPDKSNPDYWDGDVPWVSARDLKSETINDSTLQITEHAVSSGAANLVPQGSVVVLVRGMTLAHTFPVCLAGRPMAINQDLKALNSNSSISNDYLALALRGLSDVSLARVDEAGHGTKALRMDAWTSLHVPVPPEAEQVKVLEFVGIETTKLDALVSEAEKAIALLQERRSALISAAVTGKIDVHGEVPETTEAA
ncbi:Type I restriction-modification system, specificity subunit S [Roseibacterium elongatum DSM 19469]|uniref:Type I restriction-modification system, specificity subunit S n=1 Tax=Roseicyclus elongatus DSM 19469 TaxID=1294273 RepID=W8RPN3_9RHOB|nr:restriction endonuclease subunit S [Roseibacterium elongatum]AHM02973.1 Type I restriction-modification system, specificity subunit S [Roseibacterium elongatum DSM 19469]